MSDMLKNTSSNDETIPVLIVGGSLVGLSTALFLSWHGIPCLLVERHAGISPFPRAGGFNPRTMELYHAVGLEPDIRQAEPKELRDSIIVRVETLAGKELGRFTQSMQQAYDFTASPTQGSVITQNLLEPVLQAHAKKLGADLRFNTEFVSCEQHDDGVSAIIRDRKIGQEQTVHVRYLVDCEGNNSAIRQHLGIAVHGPGSLAHQMNFLFDADLRGALRGRHVLVGYVNNPVIQGGVIGADATGQRGLLSIPYDPQKGEREEDFVGERSVALIRAAVGIPDLPAAVVEIRTWEMAAYVAERFQQGSIFLAGDSAHVMPPTGGFGANTGIQDAHNLAWKLALVLKGHADPALLASYDAERRPIARLTVDQAFKMYVERMAPHRASESTAPAVDYEAIMLGYRYHSAAIASDTNDGELYEDPNHPTGHPGTRAPHVALERNGERLSTLDLFGQNFVLLTGADGDNWQAVASPVAQRLGIGLKAYRIGGNSDLVDIESRFLEAYGITSAGAVIVRPDGFIGWCIPTAAEEPERILEQALSHLLCR